MATNCKTITVVAANAVQQQNVPSSTKTGTQATTSVLYQTTPTTTTKTQTTQTVTQGSGTCSGMDRNGAFDISCITDPSNQTLLYGGIAVVGGIIVLMMLRRNS